MIPARALDTDMRPMAPLMVRSRPTSSHGSRSAAVERAAQWLRTVRAWLRPMLFAAASLSAGAAAAADGWAALDRPGAVVLFRHAIAPGVGDPPEFVLGNCATQRNLSDAGRQQARRLGDQFATRSIVVGAVLSSQWCRAQDTAQLAFGESAVRDEPAFNSTFGGRGDAAQVARARAVLTRWRGPGALVVVTHQVNIQALTGRTTSSLEGVVLNHEPAGGLRVAGTIRID